MALPDGVPRLVATDLDGTLCGADGLVSARAGCAIAATLAAGIGVVFVTARPPRWVDDLVEHVGAHGLAICTNGAFVYDVVNKVVVEADCFGDGVATELMADLRTHVPGIAFLVETATGARCEPAYVPLADDRLDDVRVGPVEGVDRSVGKLVARTAELSAGEFLARVSEVVGERATVPFSGAIGLAEIGPPGVSKASTLARWCAALGVDPGDVWAFGDMPNDLPMLAWAGSSFAVGNAHESVRRAALYWCGANTDDGVAQVLERLVRRVRQGQ